MKLHNTKKFILIIASSVVLVSSCKKPVLPTVEGAPNGTVLVVNGASNTLSLLTIGDSSVKTSGLVGGTFPHHIYMSPDQTMYAISFVGSDLSSGHGGHSEHTEGTFLVQIFDRTSGQMKKEIRLDHPAHNAIFSPDGKSLWLGQSNGSSVIHVYDTKKWKLKSEITVGNGLSEVTFSTDGTKAYAANTDENSVHVIDVATRKVIRTIYVGLKPVGAWPARNNKMYVDCEESKTIYEIDVKTNEITEIITLNYKPGYVAYNERFKELWVSNSSYGKASVYKKNNNLWYPAYEIETGLDPHALTFTPNDSIAYVSNQGEASLSQVDVSTHTQSKKIIVGEKPNGILIIP